MAEGRQTRLRVFRREDLDRWSTWPRHADPLFDGYNPPNLDERQRDEYFRNLFRAGHTRQFAVYDLQFAFVGRISLREIDSALRSAVLGVSFHPGRLGQGLGTDALTAFLEYYFGSLDMRVLVLDVAAFNLRARRVYENLGFSERGRRWGEAQLDTAGIYSSSRRLELRRYFRHENGLIRPLLLDMQITRDEWRAHRSPRLAG